MLAWGGTGARWSGAGVGTTSAGVGWNRRAMERRRWHGGAGTRQHSLCRHRHATCAALTANYIFIAWRICYVEAVEGSQPDLHTIDVRPKNQGFSGHGDCDSFSMPWVGKAQIVRRRAPHDSTQGGWHPVFRFRLKLRAAEDFSMSIHFVWRPPHGFAQPFPALFEIKSK